MIFLKLGGSELVFVLNHKYWFDYYYMMLMLMLLLTLQAYSKATFLFLNPVLGFSHSGSDMKKFLQSKIQLFLAKGVFEFLDYDGEIKIKCLLKGQKLKLSLQNVKNIGQII